MSESNENQPIVGLSTRRIEAFSDGVFAVAITLLVLEIHLPSITATAHDDIARQLLAGLGKQWPTYVSYAFSFIIVGIYWVAHHNTFHYIKQSDRTLLWINILLMMCIVFIPFPTTLIGEYPEQQISVVIYASTLVITGLVLQLLWWYATRNYRLVERTIDPQLVRRAMRRNLTGPLIYLLAIGVSFLNVEISLLVFVIVPVLYIFPGRIDRHWLERHRHPHRVEEGKEARVSASGGDAPKIRASEEREPPTKQD